MTPRIMVTEQRTYAAGGSTAGERVAGSQIWSRTTVVGVDGLTVQDVIDVCGRNPDALIETGGINLRAALTLMNTIAERHLTLDFSDDVLRTEPDEVIVGPAVDRTIFLPVPQRFRGQDGSHAPRLFDLLEGIRSRLCLGILDLHRAKVELVCDGARHGLRITATPPNDERR